MSELLSRENRLVETYNRSSRADISWGKILTVDPEKQIMTVETGANERPIEVKINNAIARFGYGIRFMPIPEITYAIVYSKFGMHYHLGYFIENAEILTDNKQSTKESAFLLQRYLEQGEVQLYGVGKNEVLLQQNGDIFIKSGSNQFLKLDDANSLLEGNFGTIKYELDSVRLRCGNIRRPLNIITNEDQYVTEEIENNTEYLKEFTVSVGNVLGEDTKDIQEQDQYGVDVFPYDGFFSIASKVHNEQGTVEQVLGQALKFLAKFPAGVSISVGEDGSFVVLDQATQNYIKLAVGKNESDEPITEFEVKIETSKLNINSQKVITAFNENGKIEIDATGKISLNRTADGSSVVIEDKKISATSSEGGKVVIESAGNTLEDKDAQGVKTTSSSTKIYDKNGNEIILASAGITIKTGDCAAWQPNILPNCIITNAPHGGSVAGIVKLKGQ